VDGRADLTIDNEFLGTAQAIETLRERFPDQVHLTATPYMNYMTLNNHKPPFDNPNVRRAVAFAIDRATVASVQGSTLVACELVPRGFPGYTPDCPYTRDAGDGRRAWTGPDLAEARRLLRDSGADLKLPVTVWGLHGLKYRPTTLYYVGLLKTLGMKNARPVWADNAPHGYYDPNLLSSVSVFDQVWGADFPAPSNFYQPIACTVPPAPIVLACDARITAQVARAVAAGQTDRAAAQRDWQQVYRLSQADASVIATNGGDDFAFTSARLGNFAASPFHGPLLDQMWVH
jgi:peptide/nickel transport system substrate-binding protein